MMPSPHSRHLAPSPATGKSVANTVEPAPSSTPSIGQWAADQLAVPDAAYSPPGSIPQRVASPPTSSLEALEETATARQESPEHEM